MSHFTYESVMSQMNESCESWPPHVVDDSCHTSELLSAFQVMSHVCHMRCQRLKKQRKRASRTQGLPPVTPIPFFPLSKRKREGRHRAPCFLRLVFFFPPHQKQRKRVSRAQCLPLVMFFRSRRLWLKTAAKLCTRISIIMVCMCMYIYLNVCVCVCVYVYGYLWWCFFGAVCGD